jgi:ribose/xylose/arabinose/galactoside ABC-type transport system permease subunit
LQRQLTGAAIIIILANEVLLLGVPVQAQMIIKGIVIMFAAAIHTRSDDP